MLCNFVLHEVSMQTVDNYQHLTKLISCPLLLKRQSYTCHRISSYVLVLVCPVLACFRYSASFSPALANAVKKGEMTGEEEEGGEDKLEPKEWGLIVLGCSRRTEWLCDIQLYPEALTDNGSALNSVTSVCPNS